MKLTISSLLLSSLIAVPSVAMAGWDIDPTHSSASFAVQHMMFSKVRGTFTGITGKIELDDKRPTKTKINVAIDAGTVDTRDAKRDGHLKAGDFFNVQKHPKMTFQSTKITKAGRGYKVRGNLTIRGVTKPVVLDAQISKPRKSPFGPMMVVGVRATTKINRKDFGMVWNKALDGGGVIVGNDVEIEINLELIKKTGSSS